MHQAPTKKDLRVFSFIWSVIFLVIGLYPLIHAIQLSSVRTWAIVIAIGFFAVGLLFPTILTGFYKVWVKFGEFIGGIISKIILLILFFGVFTPVAIILKILGKDLLNKKLDNSVNTYWIERTTQPGSLKNQF